MNCPLCKTQISDSDVEWTEHQEWVDVTTYKEFYEGKQSVIPGLKYRTGKASCVQCLAVVEFYYPPLTVTGASLEGL